MVGAWLYRQTCRLAANRVRGEVRRKRREEEFVERKGSENVDGAMMAEIDGALGQLTELERELVICRYVEERDYAEMGRRFGVSGEAVRKKVGRAVEKLRIVLEKRGVGVSTSALAVALVGLGGTKASGAIVANVTGVALKEGVVAGSGMFSLVGILAGAMGVSVVMGGVRLMDVGEVVLEVPVVDSRRAVQSQGRVLGRVRETIRGEGGRLSDEEIWESLEELDREPMTMVTDLLLEEVVKSIDAGRYFEFIDTADSRISVRTKERLCFALIDLAVEKNPVEILEGVFERDLFEVKNPNRRFFNAMGVAIIESWFGQDHAAASEWMVQNWERFEAMGEEGSLTESRTTRRREAEGGAVINDSWVDVVARASARAIYKSEGFLGVENFAGNFDDEVAATMWRVIFLRSGGGLEKEEFYPVASAEYLATLPDYEPFGSVKDLAWLKWYGWWTSDLENERGGVTKGEYLKALPVHLASDFKKSCLDEVVRDAKGGIK